MKAAATSRVVAVARCKRCNTELAAIRDGQAVALAWLVCLKCNPPSTQSITFTNQQEAP